MSEVALDLPELEKTLLVLIRQKETEVRLLRKKLKECRWLMDELTKERARAPLNLSADPG